MPLRLFLGAKAKSAIIHLLGKWFILEKHVCVCFSKMNLHSKWLPDLTLTPKNKLNIWFISQCKLKCTWFIVEIPYLIV